MMHPIVKKVENSFSPSIGTEDVSPPDDSREKTNKPTIALSTQQKEYQHCEKYTRFFSFLNVL
jgi:hypothetical protein